MRRAASSASESGADADVSVVGAPYPVLVVDRSGDVRQTNAAAEAIFPGAHPGAALSDVAPAWLAEAHRARVQVGPGGQTGPDVREPGSPDVGSGSRGVRGVVGSRSFEAHPTVHAEGTLAWWLVDETDRQVAEQALGVERERSAFLAEASNVLLSTLNVERCTEATARLAARYFAEAAVVIAPGAGRRLPVTYCGLDGEVSHQELWEDPAEVPGLSEALQGFPPVPSRWIDPALVPPWAVPEGMEPVGSVVVTPLPGHGMPAGALILLRRTSHAAFSDGEELVARLFAARAGAALSAARLYSEQAAITRILMRELLPPRLHEVHGVEFAGGYRASGQSALIGGDFYDVHASEDPAAETVVVLGDVCGKGLEAAVLTGKIRNTLAALLPMADDHQRVLSLLNGALLSSAHTRFATLVLASVVRAGTGVRLRLTSAGHPPPLIVRADATVEEVQTRGMLVGALPEIEVATIKAELAPGETCLLYTDGVTEARGGPLGDEMFGERRLRESLTDCAGMLAEAVVERIQMLATQWAGSGGTDDMALVAITAPRSTHLSAVDGHTRGRYTA